MTDRPGQPYETCSLRELAEEAMIRCTAHLESLAHKEAPSPVTVVTARRLGFSVLQVVIFAGLAGTFEALALTDLLNDFTARYGVLVESQPLQQQRTVPFRPMGHQPN